VAFRLRIFAERQSRVSAPITPKQEEKI